MRGFPSSFAIFFSLSLASRWRIGAVSLFTVWYLFKKDSIISIGVVAMVLLEDSPQGDAGAYEIGH